MESYETKEKREERIIIKPELGKLWKEREQGRKYSALIKKRSDTRKKKLRNE